ncbi:sorbosone dehydrogenase family protein [Rhodomicrobium lacus]|nr:sorbosone dehydrogenase family protein [Rhodomicrobium lacus]WKW51040.1 sorbosone dehydrogenase family protein [Rhodomicrobium lacus]
MKPTRTLFAMGFAAVALSACESQTATPVSEGMGPNPNLPPPQETTLPTVNIAIARGWGEGQKPKPAEGLQVSALARGLDHPRWLYVLPNGDVLVAESDAPPKEATGFRNWVQGKVMKMAGSNRGSANRITLLRGVGPNGEAQTREVFLENLFSPFGMALIGDTFYVANANSIVKYPYREGQTKITAAGEKLTDLPGELNHHWTKNIVASKDGTKLFVAIGSNSNIGENGMELEKDRARIWEVDVATGQHRVFASGIRNPVGMAIEPQTGVLWAAVNERDELGSDLPPDYLTSVKEGGFYGWPYSYWGQHVDVRVKPQRPDLVEKAIVPDYALGSHTASLGLTFAEGSRLPKPFANGAFIGQHGSWNRKPKSGYKVIFVPFENGKPNGMPVDVLTGFLSQNDEALGRPVGVTFDKDGALLVADDVGNVVWRVTGAGAGQSAKAD